MTSTDFTPTKVYQQNSWTVTMRDERVYLITDPSGNQCIARSVRVVNCDEIMVVHPWAPDVRLNTRKLRSLPVCCRGDLTDAAHIASIRPDYVDREGDFRGPESIFVPCDRINRGSIVYHGNPRD